MHAEPSQGLPVVVSCDMCGQEVVKVDPEGRCLSCEARGLLADIYAADAALALVGAATEAALADGYVNPGDLLERVGSVVADHRDSSTAPYEKLFLRLRDNRAAREAAAVSPERMFELSAAEEIVEDLKERMGAEEFSAMLRLGSGPSAFKVRR